ncbi:hypothetical protein BJ944DRAFT_95697 [Cunninghamella echinulata]|nr:hypothetical protein BJ944DRAFT_95697 [Cunninghamella echinulata]
MDTLNSLNPVRGNRQRASSSVTALPIPQAPEHTNHRHYQIESNLRRHPYSVLSSSAPSISQLSAQMNNNNTNGHNNNSSTDLHHKNYLHMNANEILGSFITLDFEGGTHVIVRPNRIIRGKCLNKINYSR